jgi:hypothetical protein
MTSAEARVRALCRAAARLADESDVLGRRARDVLPRTTGLSRENVVLALEEILEAFPSDAEIATLSSTVTPARRVHVVLAANVFVAAHRAIALALAQADDVRVRPSRREPEMTELLREASGGAFRVVSELEPEAGDHVWAYGGDDAIDEIRKALPAGCVFHPHGPGYGVAVVESAANGRLAAAARAIASDVVPFDQRGCLSPRVVTFVGDERGARAFAREVAAALEELEARIPLGTLDSAEAADVARFRDTARYAGELLPAGSGWVSLPDATSTRLVPPVGRNLVVLTLRELESWPYAGSKAIAAVGFSGSADMEARIALLLPRARRSALGRMQRPAFDGPVDLRGNSREDEKARARV